MLNSLAHWVQTTVADHGLSAVFVRMVPIVRTFISLPAGMARMPLGRFSVLTFLGCLPWCTGLVAIGYYAGNNWQEWVRGCAAGC